MRILGAIGFGGIMMLCAAAVATAQSVPVPIPSPKKESAAKRDSAVPVPDSRPSAGRANAPSRATGAPSRATGAPSRATGAVSAVTAPVGRRGIRGFDGNQRLLADRVSAYLSSVHTLTGNFIQIGPDGGRTEGQFYMQKPGKVRFEYSPPSPIDVIADGSSVVVRDRKLATQDLYPLSQTPLRYLLVDRIDLLRDTNLVSVSADDVFVTLVIEETHALAGKHRLMMMFGAKDFELRQWTVTDPQGYDTTVAVYNLDAKSKPDPALFRIEYTRMLE